MTTVFLSEKDRDYLEKCGGEHHFTYGIILGQIIPESEDRIILHLAKNNEMEGENVPLGLENVDWFHLTQQWASANKMLPASFEVIGFFIVEAECDESKKKDRHKLAKQILSNIDSYLQEVNFKIPINNTLGSKLNENEAHGKSEYIFLTHEIDLQHTYCKLFSNDSKNGAKFTDIDLHYLDEPIDWYEFETEFVYDEYVAIRSEIKDIDVQIGFMIKHIRKILDDCILVILYDAVDESQTVSEYINTIGLHFNEELKTMIIKLYTRLDTVVKSADQLHKFLEQKQKLHLNGAIYSRIYCHGSISLGDVKNMVCRDILRSFVERVQAYCDAVPDPFDIEPGVLKTVSLPRRIFFKMPNCSVQLCEYIFHGESPTVAIAQAKEILDLNITDDHLMPDVESALDMVNINDDAIQEENQVTERKKPSFLRSALSFGKRVFYTVLIASSMMAISIYMDKMMIISKPPSEQIDQ